MLYILQISTENDENWIFIESIENILRNKVTALIL